MTLSVMRVSKDKDGNVTYDLFKNVSSVRVNGQEVEFTTDQEPKTVKSSSYKVDVSYTPIEEDFLKYASKLSESE